jgi:hypothetical protein
VTVIKQMDAGRYTLKWGAEKKRNVFQAVGRGRFPKTVTFHVSQHAEN